MQNTAKTLLLRKQWQRYRGHSHCWWISATNGGRWSLNSTTDQEGDTTSCQCYCRAIEQSEGNCASSRAMLQIRPYENFRTKLVEVGHIMWRLHTVDEEYFIMNEYVDDGELVPNSFAEVAFRNTDGIASNERLGEDVLPVGILCMHCRFFAEEIQPRLQSYNADTPAIAGDKLPSLERKLHESRAFLNNPVDYRTKILLHIQV